jgi:hypothetical protein
VYWVNISFCIRRKILKNFYKRNRTEICKFPPKITIKVHINGILRIEFNKTYIFLCCLLLLVRNHYIPWHNWLVLGSASPNVFSFVFFWDYKTSGDLQTYFMSWEIIRKSSIWIFPGTTGSFWVQNIQTFFFVLFGSIRLQETFEEKLRAGRSAVSPQYRLRTSCFFS